MNDVIKSLYNLSIVLVAVYVMVGISSVQAQEAEKKAQMTLHHLHVSMLNHGLEMAAQGANLEMISTMEMDPNVKPELESITLQHGRNMLALGKELIQRAMQGTTMKALHKESGTSGKTMQYTHNLGNAMLEVVDYLDKMHLNFPTDKAMSLHHMHLALNHALVMAVEGSDLIMLGQMGMSPKVDDFSIEHGKGMISDAKSIWKKTVEGKAMEHLMGNEKSDLMERTHKLGDAVEKVLDLLEKMPEA
jgi:hypothetical protein